MILFGDVQRGKTELLNSLLDKLPEVDVYDNNGDTPLIIAAKGGHLEAVRVLLDWGASIDLASESGVCTPLNVAAQGGHLGVVQLLLERGALGANDTDIIHAVGEAAAGGHIQVAKALIDGGASVGPNSLYIASQNGHLEMVKFLLDNGANVNTKDNTGRTALFIAAAKGHTSVVALLLERGATVDLATDKGKTPLFGSATNGHSATMAVLLDHGALVDQVEENGITPLGMAAQSGHLEAVKLLVERGAKVDVTDPVKGSCALMVCCYRNHLKVAQFLLDNGASVDMKDKRGGTPLFAAVSQGYLGVVKLLLERGANINEVVSGFTPLLAAINMRKLDIVKLMVETKGDTLIKDDCNVALLASLMEDKYAIAELLLQLHPQLATEAPIALHIAAKSLTSESHKILGLLIANGADVNYVDKTSGSQTALHHALINKQPSKVWQLTLNGADTKAPFVESTDASDVYFDIGQLYDGDKATHEALLHFWTPQTHKLHHPRVREAIICVLLVAKRERWPFDGNLVKRILSFVAFGWIGR